MKKKTNVRTLIRTIVREEVSMAIHEVITELKQPSLSSTQPKPKKKIVEKKSFTKNSVLNEILNETAQDDDWKTMGNGTYTSDKVHEVVSSQYGDLMNGNGKVNADAMVASMGGNPNSISSEVKDNMFNKDYSKLLKAIDKKTNDKRKSM